MKAEPSKEQFDCKLLKKIPVSVHLVLKPPGPFSGSVSSAFSALGPGV